MQICFKQKNKGLEIKIKILITGASGFIGEMLVRELSEHELVLMQRNGRRQDKGKNKIFIHDLSKECSFAEAMEGVDAVIHAAALVHQLDKSSEPCYEQYVTVNVNATEALARAAISAGVKHFIFFSTIKVLGEVSRAGSPLRWNSPFRPSNAYSVSKMEAERCLGRLSSTSNMRVSIIRPPLVYGPGVKANFRRLLNLSRQTPLFPYNENFGRRSMVSVWNLVDFVRTLIVRQPNSSDVYMISDDSDCNAYELLRFMADAQNSKLYGLKIPLWALNFAFSVIGKSDYFQKIFGELRVDMTHTSVITGWKPIHKTEDGINVLLNHKASEDRRKNTLPG